jgi:SapC
MSKQLLIYESVVPLTAARHRDWSVEISEDYAFSGKVNSVPLMAVEFPHAATEYAIVFAGDGEKLMPAVILGVRDTENLFVSKKNVWDARYIPAFVRRYPFVFSASPDGKRLILCLDEAFAGLRHDGSGQRLFGDDGKPTEYVDNILKFLQEFQTQFVRTQAFCANLRDLDILEPMQAQVELGSGEKFALGGFMAVNRSKLKALSGDTLAKLAQTDELELLYLHLQSMRNFTGLKDRLATSESGSIAAEQAPPSGSGRKSRTATPAAG